MQARRGSVGKRVVPDPPGEEGTMSLFHQSRRHVLRLGVAAFAAAALAGGMLPAQAAFDSFITFGGASIQGAGANNEIQIESFSWGMGQAASTAAGSGGGAGKVRMQDLKITKKVDSASPKLFSACASGQHFTTLTLAKGGTTTVFDDVMIVNVQTAGGNPPLETLTLSYAKVETSDRPPAMIDNRPAFLTPNVLATKKP
jgi:type VI secretion system secreted protein Hcp